ncbi:hypothetical protein BGZ98_001372 [Dissophora globulifera]|nr:hypothetical protein BGZ98_001372 [Dissophora globulifera]
MNRIMLALPPPMLQYAVNMISFYFQHVRPHQATFYKHLRRLVLLALLLNGKSLPGVFHARMGFRIAAVQWHSLRHRRGFSIKPTETSVVRQRVWVDDLDLSFHLANSAYGKSCDYARVKYVTSLLGPSALPFHPMRKITFALSSNQYLYKKEIRLFQAFEIRTRLLAWNPTWFVIEHRMYTLSHSSSSSKKNNNKSSSSSKKGQTLCAISISKLTLKYAGGGAKKNKTIPFLEALEMVGHDVRALKVLEAKSDGGNVVLWPKHELEFRSFDGWNDRGAAVGNALELCEHMLAQG